MSDALPKWAFFVKLLLAFTLLWTFWTPSHNKTAEPLPDAHPAATMPVGCATGSSTGPGFEKCEDTFAYSYVPALLSVLGLLATAVRRLRDCCAIALLLRRLLLRPILFTSKYVCAIVPRTLAI